MSEGSTTPDLVERVRRIFEFVKRRHWAAILSLCAPDAVWDTSHLGVGTFEGHGAIRILWEEWVGGYEDWDMELDEIVDLGNGIVLVVNHQEGRPAGSSGYVRTQETRVYEWVGGMIKRVTTLARAITPIATVQNRYNLADRGAEPVVDHCQREDIGFIPWFPMATGRLASRGGLLQRIADEHAVTPAQLALAWLLQRSPVLLPIPGTSTVAHLEENLAAALIELTPDQVEQLDTAI
jgi:ketosteroid isomerase-like protein